jgi:hypothetical protein
MSDALKIEGGELHDLVGRLTTTIGLVNSDFLSSHVADMVGDKSLASEIKDFDTSWEVRRIHLIDELTWLKGAISTIESSFSTLESNLSSALTQPPSSSGTDSSKGKKP